MWIRLMVMAAMLMAGCATFVTHSNAQASQEAGACSGMLSSSLSYAGLEPLPQNLIERMAKGECLGSYSAELVSGSVSQKAGPSHSYIVTFSCQKQKAENEDCSF